MAKIPKKDMNLYPLVVAPKKNTVKKGALFAVAGAAAVVLLVGGCVVVGWLAVRLFLQAKREEKALEQETEQLHAAVAQENLKAPENSEE